MAWGFARSAPKVKLLPVAEISFDYLQRAEAEQFLSYTNAAAPGKSAPLYTATTIYESLRMGELWGLRWADADLARGLITVRRSATAGPHQIEEDPPRPGSTSSWRW